MRTVFHLALARDWDPNAETYPRSTRGMTIADVGFCTRAPMRTN